MADPAGCLLFMPTCVKKEIISKAVFRTLSNMQDGAFCENVNGFDMFDKVLNTPLISDNLL